ncbi:MAG TPA: hypothetical protein VD833_06995 [Vicinamibacterales bacterium]|nr:hypothetical protein [Vicinamibacterales bacterium]
MDRDVLLAIRDLLLQTRVLSLAVLVDGEPEAALLPFATAEDFGTVYVQASRLARHARGLETGAPAGVLIHAGDSPEADPMQLARLSVHATVTKLEKEGEAFASASERFIGRFPQAQMTLGFGDFNLFALTLGRGRYVEGFARAFNVDGQTFSDLASL